MESAPDPVRPAHPAPSRLPTAEELLRDWRAAGFLLIGLDGQVSLPYSDGVPESHRDAAFDLAAALSLDEDQEAEFRKWLDLVRTRHPGMRWEKLATLCPVVELGPADRGRSGRDGGQTRLEFRKLGDGRGNLSAIAVFCVDAAHDHAMARQLEEERLRHSLQIRDFLALSANPPETVGAFLEDAGIRLESVRKQWDGHQASLKRGPGSPEPLWDAGKHEGLGHRIFRELHMLKGNAGAFGFDGLAASVQESEDQLEALKRPDPAQAPAAQKLGSSLSGLRAQLDEIRRAMKLISGEGQEAMARILKWKLDRLGSAAAAVDGAAGGVAQLDPRTRALVEQSRRLPYLSPAYLARKYRNLVDRLALNQGKEVRFRVAANTGEIHPESFSRLDEALVHILRNMVDHGIEAAGERELAGKGEAEIVLEYVAGEDKVILRIRDDGRGMDADLLSIRARAMGLLTDAEAESLSDAEKLSLIFREGFSTRDRAGMVSGRGIGLSLAARCVADLGGTISVTSEAGKGTCFTVTLPVL